RHEILGEFEAEAAGIRNWAIRGLLESRDIGLRPPAQVVEATKEYREESDQFGAFLVECTEKSPAYYVRTGDLAKCYTSWCDRNGETPRYRGTRKMKSVMEDRGFKSELDRKNHPVFTGLRLKQEEESNVLQFGEA